MTTADTNLPGQTGAQEHRFPCDQCGADLRFDPGKDQLICDQCGTVQKIESIETGKPPSLRELDFKTALADALPDVEIEQTRVVTCPNCGAKTEFDADIHAAECPFCATPFVTDTGLHRQIKPKGLLPFALDESTARDAMITWLGALWFAPGGLREYARKGRRMDGIYVPYWTFDADTKSRYSGARGTHYYENRTVVRDGKSRQVRVRKTRWRSVNGRVARWFDDILVLASKSLPKKFTDGLQPWDLSALEPYKPEFLAGFRAEGYQVELEEGFQEARLHIDKVIRRDVKFDIAGDDQRISSVDTDIRNLTFKHILLPVWLAAYKYRGRSYRFVINGRTGRVQGERPWSVWKVTFAVLVLMVIAGTAGYFIAINQ